jgi:Protein of unknown function (DUF3822)
MGRINQEIVEFAFSPKATSTYELNLLVGTDSIYYFINDAQLNVLALKSFHFDHQKTPSVFQNLKTVFFEDKLLSYTYRITKIVLTTPHFTLIPNKFYDDDNRRHYFENITDLSLSDETLSDTLKNMDCQNVYLADKSSLDTVKAIFPDTKRYHVFTALIYACQKLAETRGGYQVFANLRDGLLQILFFDGRNLVFANSYTFKTPQDVLYFLLNVYEQFKLSPALTPLSMSGTLTESSDIFKFVFRYIANVQFLSFPSYFRLGQQFTGIPPHFYFDLFAVKLCE